VPVDVKFSSRGKCAFYLILPLAFVVLSLSSVQQKSPTYDETVHLFAGYSYLKWGDYRVNPEHPPLIKMLAAAPLLSLNLDSSRITPRERDVVQRDKNYGWVLAHRFVFSDNDAESLFFRARWVMLSLGLALALCIFLWARELYGFEAAVAALVLFCFDPNVIAHAPIVQTDIPFALFFFGSTYFFWRSLQQMNWLNLLLATILFALAAITKFSFVAILPIWLVLALTKIFSSSPLFSPITSPSEITGRWKKSAFVSVILLFSLVLGYLAIWTVYQFRFDAVLFQKGPFPLFGFNTDGSWLVSVMEQCRATFLLPEALIFGVSDAYSRIERDAYLLGELSQTGFWMFFPVAFLTKTPTAILLLIIITIAYRAFRQTKERDSLFLLLPAIIFFSLAVASRFNVGLRHILPIYPFLFVWMGGTVAALWKSGSRTAKVGLISLAVWLIGSTLWAYPNYVAYFNELAGGPANGHKILVDSSLDWGQDLKELKKWMDRNGVEQIQFAYFGTADPAYYKINALHLPESVYRSDPPLTAIATVPSYVAISATILEGLYIENPDQYAHFRNREPIAVLGHSIRVYKVSD
jgi:hypothetical protein